MSDPRTSDDPVRKTVAVVIGATSKGQADGPNTKLVHGLHVANLVIDGLIDSPGTRALEFAQKRPEIVMNPVKIAEAYWYLHTQDRSCWTHELQLTPAAATPSY
ncbi:hypothetical protein K2X89_12415 [Myxococcota bacterium]|nr:hypothetical protein [Myxococcota bacterium]